MKTFWLLIAPSIVLRTGGTCLGLKLIQCGLVAPPTVSMGNIYKIEAIFTRNTEVPEKQSPWS